jgi:hypothetical protein
VLYPVPRMGGTSLTSVFEASSRSRTIEASDTEVLIHGPGMLAVAAEGDSASFRIDRESPVRAVMDLLPAGSDLGVHLMADMPPADPTERQLARWELGNA